MKWIKGTDCLVDSAKFNTIAIEDADKKYNVVAIPDIMFSSDRTILFTGTKDECMTYLTQVYQSLG